MIPRNPWSDWAKRVVIEVPDYLGYDGSETAGGRQRTVRDVSRLLSSMGLPSLVIQKAKEPFEKIDRFGVDVIGLRAPLGANGGALFSLRAHKILRPNDAYLTLAQEDSWPFFVKNAKGLHTGVWWDGPFPLWKRLINVRRTLRFAEICRTVVSVDTNLINWLRCRGCKGMKLASKCIYLPNYADLSMLPQPSIRDRPREPLRILFARRYEEKRGGALLLDALSLLRKQGSPFKAILAVALGDAGEQQAKRDVAERGLDGDVEVIVCDMDAVLSIYANVDIAVVPTIWSEGTSYACVEAICSGVPVVVTAVGGLGNLVVPGFNGFVVPPTADAIADALIHLRDPNVWQPMHRAALSMRSALSYESWRIRMREWLLS